MEYYSFFFHCICLIELVLEIPRTWHLERGRTSGIDFFARSFVMMVEFSPRPSTTVFCYDFDMIPWRNVCACFLHISRFFFLSRWKRIPQVTSLMLLSYDD